jgi:rod shape-determining protein MreC
MRSLRQGSTPVLFLAAIILLFALLRPAGYTHPIEDLISTVFAPLQYGASWLSRTVGGWLRYLGEIRTMRSQVEDLQATIDRLMIENIRLREADIERAQLRELLQFKQANPTFQLLACEVIGRDSSALVRSITIDRGSADGVATGMPVVTARGLVGRITTVYASSSRVMLLTDQASSVSALIQRSRATGVVQGQGQRGLALHYVELGEEVNVGDIVLTSGLGANFPKRLVIGQIAAVRRSDIEMFQDIEVQSAVDFDRLESVLVVQDFVPTDTAP